MIVDLFNGVAGSTFFPVGTDFELGAPTQFTNKVPPALSWVVTEERLSAPRRFPGQDGQPRTLITREVDIDVHCWGADTGGANGSSRGPQYDYGAAETLMQDLVQALQSIAWGSFSIRGARWITDRGATTLLGAVVVVSVTALFPIQDVSQGAATLVSVPLTVDETLQNGTVQVGP